MAAITAVLKETAKAGPTGPIQSYSGTGTANQADTLTSGTERARKLLYVTCAYSNTPTQAGVTVTLDSGLGAGFDSLLTTGTANARYTNYIPDGDIWLMEGDAIVVAAPAGGAGLTASINIVFEKA